MDAAIKKLLQKEKPDAEEVCRILLANLIDIQNDKEGMSIEDTNRINKIIFESPESDQYHIYLEVYRTVNEANDLANNVLRQAYLACAGLKLFCENVYFANKDWPACNWEKYQLGKMSQATQEQGLWLWSNLRTTLRGSGAIKGALKIVGKFFQVSRLDTILISDKQLKKEVDSLDEFMKQSLTELKSRNIPSKIFKEAIEIFTPLTFKNSQPTKRELEEAENLLDTGFFYHSFENMVEALTPYAPEKMPGEK